MQTVHQEPLPETQESGPYKEKDVTTLDKIETLRFKLIDQLVGGSVQAPQVPGKTSEMVLLQGLIDGAERQVHTVAKVKISSKAQESEASVREEIKHLIMNYKEPPRRDVRDEELEIPARFKRPEFEDGALDIGVVPVTMKDLGI